MHSMAYKNAGIKYYLSAFISIYGTVMYDCTQGFHLHSFHVDTHTEGFYPDTENYEHATLTLSDESDIIVYSCGCHGN